MKAKSSVSRLPARTMWMIKQTSHQFPRCTGVARNKERRGFHAAVQRIGLALASEGHLPDILQRCSAIVGKSHVGFQRICPGLAKIVTGPQKRAPKAGSGRP